MKKYSEEHEWVKLQNGIATVGITAYAAAELGDITFVELPEKGKTFAQGEAMCVVESVKAASDVFIPVGGRVAEVNPRLEDTPELINASAEKDGWICKLTDVNEKELEGLMTEEQYKAFTAEK
ncbi:MAG: glycine cleavage system protein H [Lentisphaerae bacterium RIFOXYB12_FULL_65_16]|nr:MAG: glycine cleavage system protein H [Lentisphaerae bacterium RIFOXYA12_64_32]OGV87202.1 MAG: glycine cleavage system protein H [Lentisphaerae bacterium RIFOXYB12_FULL_65_16]